MLWRIEPHNSTHILTGLSRLAGVGLNLKPTGFKPGSVSARRIFRQISVFPKKKPHLHTKAYKLIDLHKIQNNLDKYKQDYISRWSNDVAITLNRQASTTRWSGELAIHLN